MTLNLKPFHDTVWLADPSRLEQIVERVRVAGRCFTGDEVRAAHRADMERAKAIAAEAADSHGEGQHSIDLNFDSGASKMFQSVPSVGSTDGPPRAIRAAPKGTKVGLIPIHGPVAQRMSSQLMKAGGTSLDFVSVAFDRLLNDPAIGAIVLHVDSPGGESFGLMELADKIYNARAVKPIYAVADSMAASAALWLASAASIFVCTPGGAVGSVGVFRMHVDESKALDEAGVKVTVVSSGKYKTELHSHQPLSEDAAEYLQGHVDGLHDKFLSALARNRGVGTDADARETVRKTYGQGRMLTPADALKVGMIDRVMSAEELLTKLTGGGAAVTVGARAEANSANSKLTQLRLAKQQRERLAAV